MKKVIIILFCFIALMSCRDKVVSRGWVNIPLGDTIQRGDITITHSILSVNLDAYKVDSAFLDDEGRVLVRYTWLPIEE